MHDDDDGDRVAVTLGSGILSPVFDTFDIRKPLPRRFTGELFDAVVRDLFDRGLIAVDAIENGFTH